METAIVRVDLNSPVKDGKIVVGDRFKAHIRSLKMLSKHYRLIVLSHQGRKGSKDFISLRQHFRILKKFLSIRFSKSPENLPKGNVLLENVRFLDDQSRLKVLEEVADIFILDAFSVSHRDEFSVTGFGLLSEPGPVLLREYENLRPARDEEFTFLLGGAKAKEVFDLIRERDDKILLGGVPGSLLALQRSGKDLGLNDVDKSNVVTPVDFVGKDGVTEEPEGTFDIGPKTIRMFKKEAKPPLVISKPLGKYEDRRYSRGTREVYRAASSRNGVKIAGGGNTLDAIRRFRIPKRSFTYLSLSGGAFLEFLARKELPGLKKVGLQ